MLLLLLPLLLLLLLAWVWALRKVDSLHSVIGGGESAIRTQPARLARSFVADMRD
jgi:hypothetical protein